jgi:hypothetical protein
VDVLQGEDHGRGQRQLAQQLENGHERAGARGGPAPDRDELGRRLHGRRAATALVLLGERSQRVGDRQQRDGGVLQVGALAHEHAPAGVARPVRELAEQPRLADAGLAADQDRPRGAAGGPLICGLEVGDLAGPAHEDPA